MYKGKEEIQIFEELTKSPVNLNAVVAGKSQVKMKIPRPGISQVLGRKQWKAATATLSRKEFTVMYWIASMMDGNHGQTGLENEQELRKGRVRDYLFRIVISLSLQDISLGQRSICQLTSARKDFSLFSIAFRPSLRIQNPAWRGVQPAKHRNGCVPQRARDAVIMLGPLASGRLTKWDLSPYRQGIRLLGSPMANAQ